VNGIVGFSCTGVKGGRAGLFVILRSIVMLVAWYYDERCGIRQRLPKVESRAKAEQEMVFIDQNSS
jgi:hypothetical protein